MKYLLTIAGHDPSSGAGIVADINAGQALDVPSLSVITCLTVQSATGGLDRLVPLSIEVIKAQLDKLFADYQIGAIKLGALASEEIVLFLADYLQDKSIPIVLDPVMQASKGKPLLVAAALVALKQHLLPLVTVITPNLAEAKLLTGVSISTEDTAVQAAQALLDMGISAVVITGGHRNDQLAADLVLAKNQPPRWVVNDKLAYSAHGTGCAFVSALTAGLVKGWSVLDAAIAAKYQVTAGIAASQQIRAVKLWNIMHTADYFPWLTCFPVKKSMLGFPSIIEPLGIYPLVANVQALEKVITAGVTCIQLRIKQMDVSRVKEQIFLAVALAKNYPKVRLFINDYWQFALEAGAYGVHLGQEDWQALSEESQQRLRASGCRLGISCHNLTELALAHHVAPSYLALGPIFHTQSKQLAYGCIGLAQLTQWASWLSDAYPVVAIGGINLANIARVKQTGVAGVALIQAATPENLPQLLNTWEV